MSTPYKNVRRYPRHALKRISEPKITDNTFISFMLSTSLFDLYQLVLENNTVRFGYFQINFRI